MTSRLDRLLLLLDTGSSSAIRETAARQIAQIAAKNVAKDAGADIVFKDLPSTSTHVWQGTSAEWADVMKVVGKILPYLRSKSFETRTAATSALSHVCQMTPAWAPQMISPPDPSSSTTVPEFPPFSVEQLLKTGTLLLSSSGTEFSEPVPLGTPAEVARARKEAMSRLGLGFMDGVDDDDLGLDKELAEEPQKQSQSQMEIDVGPQRSSSFVALSDSDDVRMSSPNLDVSRARPHMRLHLETSPLVKAEDVGSPAPTDTPMDDSSDFDLSGLSARERNRLKRKRKLGGAAFVAAPSNSTKAPSLATIPTSKVRVVATGDGPQARPLESSVKAESPEDPVPRTSTPNEKVVVDPTKGGQVEAKEKAAEALALNAPDGCWIWGGVVEVLQIDLFSPKWEIRHGAAMALREILRVRGASGGMKESACPAENLILHEKWCNSLASKFLCLFVLDRFSDFVSDQVVAPVRETVSQTLAALLSHMPRRSIFHVHKALLEMIRVSVTSPLTQTPATGSRKGKAPANGNVKTDGQGAEIAWQVRHAGLVGIKYEVAVRRDLFDDIEYGLDILQGVLDAAVSGLRDPDDDVRSVAATCITPIVNHVVERLPDYVDTVLDVLWDCLGDMKDDLSSSVGFVMDLLGKLLSFDRIIASLVKANNSRPLNQLIPLLYPFFRHTIPNVRLSVVNTLHNFLSLPNFPDEWIDLFVMRLLMQNLVVEERLDIRDVTLQVWRLCITKLNAPPSRLQLTIGPLIRDWFTLIMAPLGTPMDAGLFYHPRSGADQGHNVDKNMVLQDLSLVSSETILRARVVACRALAIALAVWSIEEQQELFGVFLEFYMNSASMLQQFLTATIIQEWALEFGTPTITGESTLTSTSPLASAMVARFSIYLQTDPPSSYYEMYAFLSRIANDCRALFAQFASDGKVPQTKIPELPANVDAFGREQGGFTLSTANDAVYTSFEALKGHVPKSRKKELPTLEAKRQKIIFSIQQYQGTKEQHDSRVAAAVAGALIALRSMPSKLNPVIRSVMNGVKFETNVDLQIRAARSVAAFVSYSVNGPPVKATPTDKIIKNLCTFICQDTDYTPVFAEMRGKLDGILLKTSLSNTLGKSSGNEDSPSESSGLNLIRRGAQLALGEIAAEFGDSLFETIPVLWEYMVQPLLDSYGIDVSSDLEKGNGQNIIDCLNLLHSLVPTFHSSLRSRVVGILPAVLSALKSQYAVIRHCSAQCFATICNVFTENAMRVVVEDVIPLLGDATLVRHRQGAIELIANIVQLLDSKVLPYLIFLIVPVLGRMSDPDDALRFIATNTFASLVKMVPLEAGLPDPPGFSEQLLIRREKERAFLTQLLDGSKVEEYKLPIPIKAELRRYQQDGVNWLAFLAKYQLHGILCDDMGLGKTLQTICIIASKHHERKERFRQTNLSDSAPLPSLIVCPPTLAGHWYHEILKYSEGLKPLVYVGSVRERTKKSSQIPQHDIIITSYDVVRNDLSVLSRHHWHYCVLDEGHVIKNAKAKLTKAVKTIQAHHRLILSGTPIQNNVLELWSLFDFLMPGFLGTESYFNEKFGRPISLSRDNKAAPKIRDAATLALEALHKQVLPFLLRRLKEDVLSDLPPKIIQDHQCDLSDLQKRLYDEFASSQARLNVENEIKKAHGQKNSGQKHVFQSLQYLRKLCNHPALVIKDPAALTSLSEPGLSPPDLRDISHAPKLEALRQLLVDCGVGVASTSAKDNEATLDGTEAAIAQHRVLIFCQMKQMLDIIETDLFQVHMPSVTYMRLDGTTDAAKRHAVVETFNADPSIDCLLLTTHVGGLGLTLTGADTVIFVEHDWNPMKDLQAMDRAHRLGQKKVVNVYRLITKGTLEEKIMGLQRFKLNIANSVITQQNSGLSSMDTDLVLDLFERTTDDEDASRKRLKQIESDKPASQKNVLEGLEDLPPEDEYSFDFSAFLGSLGPLSQ